MILPFLSAFNLDTLVCAVNQQQKHAVVIFHCALI